MACSSKRSTTVNLGATIQPTIVESSEEEYDVFLSFRGGDTGKYIVDHLYLSLKEAQIKVFMDGASLSFGDDIERKLLAAIRRSKIAITIISEDYASSAYCLKELAHILKRSESGRLMVIPIFYEVNPSDIRRLRSSFERIQSHILKYDGTTVQSWKDALIRIGHMKGFVVDDTSCLVTIVRLIVEMVQSQSSNPLKMNFIRRPKRKRDTDHLVGIDEHARCVVEAFPEDRNRVQAVGIEVGIFDDDSSSSEPMSNICPTDRICWNFTNWKKGDLLGGGTFGSVYEGIAEDGSFFAVKEVSLLDQGTLGRQSVLQLEQEIRLLSQFKHENIVRYYGTAKDDSKLYIFLELVTKGSLLNLYKRYRLRDSQVSAYTRQILHGLTYLHGQNVLHRDIKCANILVDASGSVKLADFGLAKSITLNDVKSCRGTAFWMAPEVVMAQNQNRGYGLPADIWSLGCTVLEMLTGQVPYAPLEWMAAIFRIGKGELPPVPETLSNDARDFILKCLQVNPEDRPTAAQLLNHPFVRRPLPGP